MTSELDSLLAKYRVPASALTPRPKPMVEEESFEDFADDEVELEDDVELDELDEEEFDSMDAPVRLLPLLDEMPNLPAHTACLGLAADSRPLLLRLPSADVAHILVTGASGAGKTELLRTMLISLALTNRQSRLQLALIDPQTRGLAPLAGLPHLLSDPASDLASALDLLDRLSRELDHRADTGTTTPRIVIAIDELLALFTQDELAGRRVIRSGYTIEQTLTRFTERGRALGMHLLAGVQRPAPSVANFLERAQFPVRIVGRAPAPDVERLAGQSGTGAENLMGHGDFLALAAGQFIRFQAAWFSAQDWAHITRRTDLQSVN